LITACK